MLDVVENIERKADLADDAEIQVVENMRKLGSAALQEWATQRGQSVESEWIKKHPTASKHGKKKFIGKQPWDNKR